MKFSKLSLIAAVLGSTECSAFFGSLTRTESFANIQKNAGSSTQIFMGDVPPPADIEAIEYVAAAPEKMILACKVTSWISSSNKNAFAEKVALPESISETAVVASAEAATVEIPVSIEESTDVQMEAVMNEPGETIKAPLEEFVSDSTIQDATQIVQAPVVDAVEMDTTAAVLMEDPSVDDSFYTEELVASSAAQEESEMQLISESVEQPSADSAKQLDAAPEVVGEKEDSMVAFPELQTFVDEKDGDKMEEPSLESTASTPEIVFAATSQVEPTFEEDFVVSQKVEEVTSAEVFAVEQEISVSPVEVVAMESDEKIMNEVLGQDIFEPVTVSENADFAEESMQVVSAAASLDTADSPEMADISQV